MNMQLIKFLINVFTFVFSEKEKTISESIVQKKFEVVVIFLLSIITFYVIK